MAKASTPVENPFTQAAFLRRFHDNLEEKGWEGLKRSEINELLDTLHDTIVETLKIKPPKDKHAVAVVRGVGRFTKKDLPRRKGIKPFTDPPEQAWFPAKKSLRVTADSKIKKAINPPKKK